MIENKKEEFLKYFLPIKSSIENYAKAMCRTNEDAKDVVSETILISYEKWDKIRDKKALLSFMFTTAKRIYSRLYNRNSIFKFFENNDEVENLRISENKSTNHDVNILYGILNKLPEKQKETIVLFEISELSLEEIRTIQGGTISGVKSRLKRAREFLKAQFQQDIYIYNSTDINQISNSYDKTLVTNLKVLDE